MSARSSEHGVAQPEACGTGNQHAEAVGGHRGHGVPRLTVFRESKADIS